MSSPNQVSDTRGAPSVGAALDNLVAQHVFGWPAPVYITDECHDPNRPLYAWRECHRTHEEFEACEHQWWCGDEAFFPAPTYSTDIAAAWEVVTALDQRGKAFSLERRRRDSLSENAPATWLANIWAPLGWGESESAPDAICLAALKAVAP